MNVNTEEDLQRAERLSGEVEIEEMREADLDEVLAIEKRSFVAPWSKRLFRETLSFPCLSIW